MSRSFSILVMLLLATVALAAPAPQLFKTGWDKPVDPDKDCKFICNKDMLTIEVPGKDHDIAPKRKRFNAPRLLRDIEGDFMMQVRVRGSFGLSAESTAEGMPSRVGAGLLLMLNDKVCIEWEYGATHKEEGAATYRTLRTWDSVKIHLEGGGTVFGHGNMDQAFGLTHEGKSANQRAEEAESFYLRLERDGRFLRLLSSPDGEKWEALFNTMKNVEVARLPAKLKVGLAAYSTSTEPSKVVFDQFKLKQGKGK